MFIRLSKRIVRHCCKGEGSDENELYIFGVNQFLNMLLNILTALFIGILFGETLQIILFMLAYIPLRSYAGGWHSRTPLRCYIFSVIMLIVVSVGMKYLYMAEWVYYVILAAAASVVLILASVEDRNKPLDEIEHKIYKRRTVIITAAELIIALLLKLLISDDVVLSEVICDCYDLNGEYISSEVVEYIAATQQSAYSFFSTTEVNKQDEAVLYRYNPQTDEVTCV